MHVAAPLINRLSFARRRPAVSRSRRGFTLIETALATIIVGVGVLAMVSAQTAFHKQNFWSTHAGTACRLGNEIREMTLNWPRNDPVTGLATWGVEAGELWPDDYDDLDDLAGGGLGTVFADQDPDLPADGPINARREIIPNMRGWGQEIYVDCVEPDSIVTLAEPGLTKTIRMTVVVTYQGPNDLVPEPVTTVSWIAPN